MPTKSVAELFANAQARVERARARHTRAVSSLWMLLGWGEDAKVTAADEAVAAANKELIKAQAQLEQFGSLQEEQ